MAKRKNKIADRKQLAFDLDSILVIFEDAFIKKLTIFFNKLANKFLSKVSDLQVFKKNLTSYKIDKNTEEVLQLKKFLKDFYKKIGKESIKALNTEIKDLSGKRSKIVIPNINEDMRLRAETLAIKKVKDFRDLIVEKLDKTSIQNKKDLIRTVKTATKVFQNKHITIVSRMESVTAVNNARLEAGQESKIIKGWQFLAVLDKRTTQICRSRNGMVLKKDDENLITNFKPPCHWGCRSLLSPVSIYEEDLSFTSPKDIASVPPKDFGKNPNIDFL
jgi:SPP1 gp7 family putative phage head morphogenesis protein